MKQTIRVVALCLYVAVTLGGAGLHLLEFASEDGCPGCTEPSRGPSLVAHCGEGPSPCRAPSHSHHTHPVRHNEDGCVTCTALASQQAVSTAPIDFAAAEATSTPPADASAPPTHSVHRPSDRAPPAL